MQGTSRAGWAAIHIAAERAGIPRPVCGDGIEVTYREIPGAGGQWEILFSGTNPGQRLRFVPVAKLKPSVKTERHSVGTAEVDAYFGGDVPKPSNAFQDLADQMEAMRKAFGPEDGKGWRR